MITRLPLLLIVVISIVMLGRVQESTTSASPPLTCRYETGALPQKYMDVSTEVRNLFPRSRAPHSRASELFASIAGGEAEDMLKMYYDISALPLKKRKAAYRNASSNNKSALWKTHFALFLVKRPDLNEWQKQVILSAIALATPEHFGVRSSDPAWKAKLRDLRFLEEQILLAFSPQDGAKIFATLGDDDTESYAGSVLLQSINYKPLSDSGPYKTHNQFAVQDFDLERSTCECSTESDWCPGGSACSGAANCSSTNDGCGTIWGYPCNGACR